MFRIFFTGLHHEGTQAVVKTRIERDGMPDVIREFRPDAEHTVEQFTAALAHEIANDHGGDTPLVAAVKSWIAAKSPLQFDPAALKKAALDAANAAAAAAGTAVGDAIAGKPATPTAAAAPAQ